MPRHDEARKTPPARPEDVPEPRPQERKKTDWPSGIQLSKLEKLGCFLPEDLKVVLTKDAFEQLFGYAYAAGTEISCLGSVRREGNIFVVERFYLVKQDGSSAHTEMEGASIAALLEELLSQGKGDEAKSLKCWAHSHPGMGVFWSKTDENTCNLLAADYLVSLVVSEDFAIRCRIDTQTPIPFALDNVPVVCQVMPDETKLAGYAKEVAEKVKESFGLGFGQSTIQQPATGIVEDDAWSEYFRSGYALFDDEETAELRPVREESDIPF